MRLTPWLSMFAKSPVRRKIAKKDRGRLAGGSFEALEERVLPATFYVDATPTDNVAANTDVFTPGAGSHTTVGGLELGVNLFTTIGGAIAAAAANGTDNDIILVADGTYNEGNTINENLTIRGNQFGVNAESGRVGANESIINFANGSFAVNATGVTIDGFTLQGQTGAGAPGFGANVRLVPGSSATSILNNIVQNNTTGVFLTNAGPGQTLIQANLFRNNNNPGAASGHDIYADQYTAGTGGVTNVLIDNNTFTNSAFQVDAWAIGISNTDATPFTNIDITNNDISNHGRGMYFFSTDDATITGNTITGVTNYGVGVFESGVPGTENSNFVINGNSISGTGPGVSIDAGGYTGPIVNTNNGTVDVFGTSGDDTATLKLNGGVLELTVGGNVYNVTGATSIDFTGGVGTDKFTLDYGGGVFTMPINFDGGGGAGSDELIIQGGTFANGHVIATGVGSGTIQYTGAGLVTFTGLEPITDDNVVTDYVIDASAGADTIIIENSAGNRTIVREATDLFESVAFKNKTNVTVNGLAGANDSITLADNSSPATGLASLTVNGGGDAGDTITINGALSLAAGSLTLTAPSISQTAGAVALTTLNLNGAVDQSGGTVAISGTTTVVAGSGNVSLAQSGNTFGTVVITSANNASVRDDGGFVVGGATASTSITLTSAGGTVTETAAISTPLLTLQGAAGTFSLGSQNNAVTTLDADNSSLASLTFKDDTGYAVAGIDSAGAVTLESAGGTVTQTAAISGTTLTLQGTSGTFSLGSQNNAVTTLDANNSTLTALTFKDDSGYDVAGATASGAITLDSAGGTVTQSAVISGTTLTLQGAAGTFNLGTQNNAVTTLDADNSSLASLTFKDDTGYAVAGINSAGAVTLESASGTVTQTAAISGTTLTLQGTSGTFSLGSQNNAVTTLDANNSTLTALTFKDDLGYDVAGATANGAITLDSAGGTVTQSAVISGTTLTLQGAAGAFDLSSQNNAVTTLDANNSTLTSLTFKDDTGYAVAGATASGTITLESAGGTVTQSAVISGTTLTLQGAGGTFSLGSQNNAVTTLDANNTTLTALTFKDDTGYDVAGGDCQRGHHVGIGGWYRHPGGSDQWHDTDPARHRGNIQSGNAE